MLTFVATNSTSASFLLKARIVYLLRPAWCCAACGWRRCEAWWGQPLRPLGSNAQGLFCHAATLRLLGSYPQGLLFLALPLGAHSQGLFWCALSLGLISCNATGLLLRAETLSLGLLLLAQPVRLLEQPHAITGQPRASLEGVPQRYPLSQHDTVGV